MEAKYFIESEQLDEFNELIEDTLAYFCDEYMVSRVIMDPHPAWWPKLRRWSNMRIRTLRIEWWPSQASGIIYDHIERLTNFSSIKFYGVKRDKGLVKLEWDAQQATWPWWTNHHYSTLWNQIIWPHLEFGLHLMGEGDVSFRWYHQCEWTWEGESTANIIRSSDTCNKNYKKVFMVLGNHEHYFGDIEKTSKRLKKVINARNSTGW